MNILSKSFGEKWQNYVWQSAGAGLSIIILLIVFTDVIGLVLVAAAGSTAFTVFALPHNRTAKTRNIVGGHVLCVVVGLLSSYFAPVWLAGGLAVSFGSFLMVLFDAEHPPAAGSALGLAASPTFAEAAFILATALVFSLIRIILEPWLKDLY